MNTTKSKARLALLGTVGHLHTEPLKYDLACLRSLVETLEPDLLGVEMDPVAWEQGDLSGAPLEVRDVLVPAARRLDTIIVPLGAPSPTELAPPTSGGLTWLRADLVRGADHLLTALQRAADSPEKVNSPLFSHVCGLICSLEAAAAGNGGRHDWEATNEHILERVLWALCRDPGRRMLVAVQCRRVHRLGPPLKRQTDLLELVDYWEL